LTDTNAIIVTDTNAIIERLGAVFVERFHVEVPSADIDLLESGILDSFQFVELLLELEQRFGFRIKLDDIELDDLRTLKRIARLVAAHGAAARPTAVPARSGAADSL
jgi:D-alanine--poly(phosphoribitol) ligase subunit 2